MIKTAKLTRIIARYLITLLFFLTVGFSLFLSPDLSWPSIVSSLIKGLLLSVASWIFFLIISDTFVKSLLASAREASLPPEQRDLLSRFVAAEGSTGAVTEPEPRIAKTGKKR